MFTVLWCYTRNPAFKTKDVDYHLSADLTGQANHLGVTIQADIIKQKLPENNGGYNAVNFGKTHKAVYSQLTSDNPIDLTRYQVANCYMGRIPLDQLRRRLGRRERSEGSGPNRGHQQTRRRDGTDLGPQGVPAPGRRRRRAAQRDSGRVSVEGRDGRLIDGDQSSDAPKYSLSASRVLRKASSSHGMALASNVPASSPSSSTTSSPASQVAA